MADDDPSSIGTYAVAGASLGLSTLWTALFTYPFLAATQNVCARVGMVNGAGIAGVIRRRYPRAVLYPAIVALVIANTITIGADLAAIADAVRIFVDVPVIWLVAPVSLFLVAVQVFVGYRQLLAILGWVTVVGLSMAVIALAFAAQRGRA